MALQSNDLTDSAEFYDLPEELKWNHYVHCHDFIKTVIRLYSFNLFHWNILSHDMNATRYRQFVR